MVGCFGCWRRRWSSLRSWSGGGLVCACWARRELSRPCGQHDFWLVRQSDSSGCWSGCWSWRCSDNGCGRRGWCWFRGDFVEVRIITKQARVLGFRCNTAVSKPVKLQLHTATSAEKISFSKGSSSINVGQLCQNAPISAGNSKHRNTYEALP